MSNYAVLFVGIIFANMLLMFGLMLPSVLDHYQVEMENGMLSKYQYMLQMRRAWQVETVSLSRWCP